MDAVKVHQTDGTVFCRAIINSGFCLKQNLYLAIFLKTRFSINLQHDGTMEMLIRECYDHVLNTFSKETDEPNLDEIALFGPKSRSRCRIFNKKYFSHRAFQEPEESLTCRIKRCMLTHSVDSGVHITQKRVSVKSSWACR
jgi:hypothetical protein